MIRSVVRNTSKKIKNVRVAQLDRASDYGSEGREFESSAARHEKALAIASAFFSEINPVGFVKYPSGMKYCFAMRNTPSACGFISFHRKR